MNLNKALFLTGSAILISLLPAAAEAQLFQVIQLPTIRTFRTNTVVSVPDGGSIRLGGVNSHREQSIRSGSGLPGPLFNNRGISRETTSANAVASAELIIMSEYEEAVLAEARRRRLASQATNLNGPPAVQAKADFITRNIGRSRKR